VVTKNKDGEYIRVQGGYLEIRQKLGEGVISGTGKSRVLASTGGFQAVDGSDIRVNLVAIKKN
jgi:hypothetical protein